MCTLIRPTYLFGYVLSHAGYKMYVEKHLFVVHIYDDHTDDERKSLETASGRRGWFIYVGTVIDLSQTILGIHSFIR